MKRKIFEAWIQKEREDLRLASYAESLGYMVHCIPKNKQDIPGDPITFTKDNRHIWECITRLGVVWRCADIVDGYFRNHRSYIRLKNALEKEKE